MFPIMLFTETVQMVCSAERNRDSKGEWGKLACKFQMAKLSGRQNYSPYSKIIDEFQ